MKGAAFFPARPKPGDGRATPALGMTLPNGFTLNRKPTPRFDPAIARNLGSIQAFQQRVNPAWRQFPIPGKSAVRDRAEEKKDETLEKPAMSDKPESEQEQPAEKVEGQNKSGKEEPALQQNEDLAEKKEELGQTEEESPHKESISREKEEAANKKEESAQKKEESVQKKEEPSQKKHVPSQKGEEPERKKEEASENKEEPRQKEENLSQKKEEPSQKKEEPPQKKEVLSQKKEVLSQKNEEPSQKKEAPAQKKEEPSQKKGEPSQKKEAPAQKKEEPSMKKEALSQKKEEPLQKKEEHSQKKEVLSQKKKEPLQKKEESSQKKEVPAKTKDLKETVPQEKEDKEIPPSGEKNAVVHRLRGRGGGNRFRGRGRAKKPEQAQVILQFSSSDSDEEQKPHEVRRHLLAGIMNGRLGKSTESFECESTKSDKSEIQSQSSGDKNLQLESLGEGMKRSRSHEFNASTDSEEKKPQPRASSGRREPRPRGKSFKEKEVRMDIGDAGIPRTSSVEFKEELLKMKTRSQLLRDGHGSDEKDTKSGESEETTSKSTRSGEFETDSGKSKATRKKQREEKKEPLVRSAERTQESEKAHDVKEPREQRQDGNITRDGKNINGNDDKSKGKALKVTRGEEKSGESEESISRSRSGEFTGDGSKQRKIKPSNSDLKAQGATQKRERMGHRTRRTQSGEGKQVEQLQEVEETIPKSRSIDFKASKAKARNIRKTKTDEKVAKREIVDGEKRDQTKTDKPRKPTGEKNTKTNGGKLEQTDIKSQDNSQNDTSTEPSISRSTSTEDHAKIGHKKILKGKTKRRDSSEHQESKVNHPEKASKQPIKAQAPSQQEAPASPTRRYLPAVRVKTCPLGEGMLKGTQGLKLGTEGDQKGQGENGVPNSGTKGANLPRRPDRKMDLSRVRSHEQLQAGNNQNMSPKVVRGPVIPLPHITPIVQPLASTETMLYRAFDGHWKCTLTREERYDYYSDLVYSSCSEDETSQSGAAVQGLEQLETVTSRAAPIALQDTASSDVEDYSTSQNEYEPEEIIEPCQQPSLPPRKTPETQKPDLKEEPAEEDGKDVNFRRMSYDEHRKRATTQAYDTVSRSQFYDPDCAIPVMFNRHETFNEVRLPHTSINTDATLFERWVKETSQGHGTEAPFLKDVPSSTLAQQEVQKIIISRDLIAENSVYIHRLPDNPANPGNRRYSQKARQSTVDRLTVVMTDDASMLSISNHSGEPTLVDPDLVEKTEKMFRPLREFEKSDVDYSIFLLPRLLPLPLLPDLKEKLEHLDVGKRDGFLKTHCEKFITSDVVPICREKIANIPIFGGYLTRKKGFRKVLPASIFGSMELVIGDETIPLNGVTASQNGTKSKFTIFKNKKPKHKFYTDSPESAGKWASVINDLVQGTSVQLLNVFLFAYASHFKYCSMREMIISAMCSPDISLVMSLLNNDTFSLSLVERVFEILTASARIDYVTRTLLLAEMTKTPYNHIFTVNSSYSTAFLVLFVGVAGKWITEFAKTFVERKLKDAEDMIELTMMAFATIPERCLFLVRILLLTTTIRVPEHSHPMIPFFNFMMAAIRPFVLKFGAPDWKNHHEIWIQLPYLLTSSDQFQSKAILILAPFLEKVLRAVPFLEQENPLDDVNVESIYTFMLQSVGSLNSCFTKLLVRSPREHPLLASYYQNLRFLMRDLCPTTDL